jgi:transposase-like protein
LDEVFVKINGNLSTIFAALSTMRAKSWRPGVTAKQEVVTDRLRAYSAAMKEIGAADRHEVGGRFNNRAENSRRSFADGSARCSGFEV